MCILVYSLYFVVYTMVIWHSIFLKWTNYAYIYIYLHKKSLLTKIKFNKCSQFNCVCVWNKQTLKIGNNINILNVWNSVMILIQRTLPCNVFKPYSCNVLWNERSRKSSVTNTSSHCLWLTYNTAQEDDIRYLCTKYKKM